MALAQAYADIAECQSDVAASAKWETLTRGSSQAKRKMSTWSKASAAAASEDNPGGVEEIEDEIIRSSEQPLWSNADMKRLMAPPVKAKYVTTANAKQICANLKAKRKAAGTTAQRVQCPVEDCTWSYEGTKEKCRSKLQSHKLCWHKDIPRRKKTPLQSLEEKKEGAEFTWKCKYCSLGMYEQANTKVAIRRRQKHHKDCHPMKSARDFTLHAAVGGTFQRNFVKPGVKNRESQCASRFTRRIALLRARGHEPVASCNPLQPLEKWQSCRRCFLSAQTSCSSWNQNCEKTGYKRPAFARKQIEEWNKYFNASSREPSDAEKVHRDTLEQASNVSKATHQWERVSGFANQDAGCTGKGKNMLNVCKRCGLVYGYGTTTASKRIARKRKCDLQEFSEKEFRHQHKFVLALYERWKKHPDRTTDDNGIMTCARGRWLAEATRREQPAKATKHSRLTESALQAAVHAASQTSNQKRRRF